MPMALAHGSPIEVTADSIRVRAGRVLANAKFGVSARARKHIVKLAEEAVGYVDAAKLPKGRWVIQEIKNGHGKAGPSLGDPVEAAARYLQMGAIL